MLEWVWLVIDETAPIVAVLEGVELIIDETTPIVAM